MGQVLACKCFEGLAAGVLGDNEAKERLYKLQKGGTFMRSILLGMSSQKIFVRLNDDATSVQWKTEPGSWAAEMGEIDLTKIKLVKLSGHQGFQFISVDHDKVLLDIQAEDSGVRDQWMVAISEILEKWNSDPNSKPQQASLSAANTSNKAEYFQQREKEMAERAKQREEKKKKYSAGGLVYTAQVMASR